MNCVDVQADYGLVPEASLPEPVREHLTACVECQRYREQFATLGAGCASLGWEATPSDLFDRVAARVRDEIAHRPLSVTEVLADLEPVERALMENEPAAPSWKHLVAAAAGFVAAVVGASYLTFQPSREPGRTISRAEPVTTIPAREAFAPVPTTVAHTAQDVFDIPPGVHPGYLEYSLIEVENPNSATNRPPDQNWPSSRDRTPLNSGLLPANSPQGR